MSTDDEKEEQKKDTWDAFFESVTYSKELEDIFKNREQPDLRYCDFEIVLNQNNKKKNK